MMFCAAIREVCDEAMNIGRAVRVKYSSHLLRERSVEPNQNSASE